MSIDELGTTASKFLDAVLGTYGGTCSVLQK